MNRYVAGDLVVSEFTFSFLSIQFITQLIIIKLPMAAFKPGFTGVGSNHATNLAKTIDKNYGVLRCLLVVTTKSAL